LRVVRVVRVVKFAISFSERMNDVMNDNAIDRADCIIAFLCRARGLLGAFRKYALPEDRNALADDLYVIEEQVCDLQAALRKEIAPHTDFD
jgi:hypothetical protein